MKIREKRLTRALSNWPGLVKEVSQLREPELEELLRRELERSPPRELHVTRIHQRLSKLRSMRERKTLLREIRR